MTRLPSILVPYAGPCLDDRVQDVALYLRPESNGVKVESTLMRVVHGNPEYRKHMRMAYLADIPGDFIAEKRIVEKHYALKILFARQGKQVFTAGMRRDFERFFGIPFRTARILGAFEAMESLGLNEEEMFRVWVPENHMLRLHDQMIKRYGDVFIVNCDIPALLSRNSAATDIFSMIIRSFLPYSEVHAIVREACLALQEEGILIDPRLYSHVFHYSKGPFEQILDGIGYVFIARNRQVDPEQLSFFAYLMSRHCSREEILQAIQEPIMNFRAGQGKVERNLFAWTAEDSFAEACRKFQTRVPRGERSADR